MFTFRFALLSTCAGSGVLVDRGSGVQCFHNISNELQETHERTPSFVKAETVSVNFASQTSAGTINEISGAL